MVTLHPTTDKAIQAIAEIGLSVIGGRYPRELLRDNMSWFNARELASAMVIDESTAAAIMIDLSAHGMAVDSGETVNGIPGPTDWYLTETGIRYAGDLRDSALEDKITKAEIKESNIQAANPDLTNPDSLVPGFVGLTESQLADYRDNIARDAIESAIESDLQDDIDGLNPPSVTHISAYPNNRPEMDLNRRDLKPIPLVSVFQNGESPWESDSVSFSPRNARLIAAELLKAADSAECGLEYSAEIKETELWNPKF